MGVDNTEEFASKVTSDHVFKDLDADDLNSEPTIVESMCMSCGENGMTRLLLTKIPHYKEIILMSFHCEECGFKNNEIQSGGVIQEKGVRITVTLANERDLSRQVVRSDSASVLVPSIDLEIPATGQKGEVTTLEGLLLRTISGLSQDQVVRRIMHPEDAEKIDQYIEKVEQLLTVAKPFELTVVDPSGNSWVENPYAPQTDTGKVEEWFERSREEDNMLGLYSQEQLNEEYEQDEVEEVKPLTEERLKEEVLTFPTNCGECNAPANTNMKITNIPYFKEVVIMCTSCDHCGARSNEVKSGGGMEEQGKKITLNITDPSDMSRDVLKSDTCSIAIPELDFEMGGMSVGGKFTTLEGLLTDILDQVEKNSLWGGDAAAPDVAERMKVFKAKFQDCIAGKGKFTLILDDAAGNSYVQNVYAPEEDPELTVERYTRSFEQNDELGLNDMKVEGYQEEQS